MIRETDLRHILFLDIETVAVTETFEELPERLQKHWAHKCTFFLSDVEKKAAEWYPERAGIYAEFGKIIAIAVGFITSDQAGVRQLRITDFAGDDEKELLEAFAEMITQRFEVSRLIFCAHNGKEFDYPYLCRRMLLHQIALPLVAQLSGKKPWENPHLDTMELWKFADRKNFTSLDLLASLFDIPSSKSDMDGSMVNQVYYKENDLEKIRTYCKQDVYVTAQLLLRLNYLEPIDQNQVIVV